VNDPAVALNVALVAFAGIETLEGTVTVLLEVKLMTVLVANELLSVTVQTAVADGANEDGLQESPLSVELGGMVWLAVPPVALMLVGLPATDAPRAPEIPITAEVVLLAKVIETVAIVPLAITLVFIPLARQVYALAEPAQFSVFAAATSAGPGFTVKPVMEAAG
jgi:hypothetical protein